MFHDGSQSEYLAMTLITNYDLDYLQKINHNNKLKKICKEFTINFEIFSIPHRTFFPFTLALDLVIGDVSHATVA